MITFMADYESKSKSFTPPVRGRGAIDNPSGRFEKLNTGTDAETYNMLCEAGDEEPGRQIPTQTFRDTSRTIVSTNDSPDVGIEASVNPYRGCEHGCIYCYARPSHEYLGLSAGLDFETKIFVKPDAPKLLAEKLRSRSWQPKVITLSGITDPYQPLEKKLQITRGCFEVLRNFRNPAMLITKNFLVTRDIDIFREMAAHNTIAINISLTTLDRSLARVMEPRTAHPERRLQAIEMLAAENIPVGIMMGPVLPGLTDHEIPSVLKAASDAGALWAGYTMLRLPYGVKDLFVSWLEEHFPDRAQKVLNRIGEVRGGKLNDSSFGTRMRGTGPYAEQIAQMFTLYKRKYRLDRRPALSVTGFQRREQNGQLDLFG